MKNNILSIILFLCFASSANVLYAQDSISNVPVVDTVSVPVDSVFLNMLSEARQLFKDDKTKKAIKLYTKIIKTNPCYEAYYWRGNCYRYLGWKKYLNACDDYRSAICCDDFPEETLNDLEKEIEYLKSEFDRELQYQMEMAQIISNAISSISNTVSTGVSNIMAIKHGNSSNVSLTGVNNSVSNSYGSIPVSNRVENAKSNYSGGKCTSCQGTGKCSTTSGAANKYFCHGSGRCQFCSSGIYHSGGVDVICNGCHGNGKCKYCNGTGKCSKCNGTGRR